MAEVEGLHENRVNAPQRIAIVGISGSGKTTFVKALAQRLGLPVYHADSLDWMPDWQERPADEIMKTYSAWLQQRQWIIEGWIDIDRTARLDMADLVIDLDYSWWRCTLGTLRRMLRHQRRSEMPPGCVDRFDWRYLKTVFLKKERPFISRALEAAHAKVYSRFSTPGSARAWLQRLSVPYSYRRWRWQPTMWSSIMPDACMKA